MSHSVTNRMVAGIKERGRVAGEQSGRRGEREGLLEDGDLHPWLEVLLSL